MASNSQVPTLLAGRYRLGPVIGGGGMATVHAAWDTRLDRHVAVKSLHAHLAADAAMRGRFEDEGRTAARLAHPNVVQVYDSGESDGVPYLVMELVDGPTLAERIAEGPIPPEEARAIALGIARALAAAHEQGIVHRDIKPANVLLVDGVPKVADFGIARAVEGLDRDTTTVILGTPTYVAPEYLAGEPATPRSDVYGAGIVLAEMLTGGRPRGEAAPDLVPSAPDAPGALAALVASATDPDPARRPADGAALAEALADPEDIAEPEPDAGDPTVAIRLVAASDPAGTVAMAPAADGAPTRTLPPRPVPPRPAPTRTPGRSVNPLVIAALGALLIIALALGVGALAGGDDSIAPPTTTTTTTTVAPPTTTVRAAPAAGPVGGPAAKAPKAPKAEGGKH